MNPAESAARRLLKPFSDAAAAFIVRRLLGHWVTATLIGNREQMQMFGFKRTDLFGQDKQFRQTFGAEVREFRFHPDDAALLIAYLALHQDPEQKRVFGETPASNRMHGRVLAAEQLEVD